MIIERYIFFNEFEVECVYKEDGDFFIKYHGDDVIISYGIL